MNSVLDVMIVDVGLGRVVRFSKCFVGVRSVEGYGS